ncbi:MAG: hypothetical protein JOZ57_06785, partial [Abitibacteriaceae bacterium]|nr:hypothetical protein [Abditibacteriaceae bacterium]
MGQASYIVLAFSVLNLMLAACGLLLVYFDWSAARRREFLYLSFSEDKPGVNYFAAARRRRAQYTRLIGAFIVLLVREFLSVLLYAQVTKSNDWSLWVQWWAGHAGTSDLSSIAVAINLYNWVTCLGILSVILLGYGILYEPQEKKGAAAGALTGVFVAFWVAFTIVAVTGVLGTHSQAIVADVTFVVRIGLICGIIYGLRQRGLRH